MPKQMRKEYMESTLNPDGWKLDCCFFLTWALAQHCLGAKVRGRAPSCEFGGDLQATF